MTLAFAAVIGVVLAATGLFIHQRVASNLERSIDRSLRARAADVGALAQQSDSGLREARGTGANPRGAQFAELIDASGRVLDRTPGLPSRPLVAASALGAARRDGPSSTERRLAGRGPVRLLAQPVVAQDQLLVVVVGQTLAERDQGLADLTAVLLLGGPAALALASLAGYVLTGAALRPVEAMRRRERTFVSDASHELRSPLAVLRTELELIAQERPAGEDLLAAVGSAIEETDRLRALTDDLLLLSRADDRRLLVRPATVQAAELLQAAADRARRQAARPGTEIAVDAPADALVLADRDRMEQALDNLVANALRHGDGRLELRARVEPGTVELHVLDHGPGFPPGFLPHAWERFARGDAARTDGGAGLGLAIVRRIAELHGGRAEAANRPGGGADVWISLPRAARPRAARAAAGGGAVATLFVAACCASTPSAYPSVARAPERAAAGRQAAAQPGSLSERESRLAVRAIERIRPDVTIWFHQPQTIVRAYGHSEPAARRYARLAGMAYRRIHWPSGSAPNWQNHQFRNSAAFVVELARGPLGAAAARRHVAAIARLAR